MGRDLAAEPRRATLMASVATVPTVGHKRVKPCVNLRPTAQAISKRPARIRRIQGITILAASGSSLNSIWRGEVVLASGRTRPCRQLHTRQGFKAVSFLLCFPSEVRPAGDRTPFYAAPASAEPLLSNPFGTRSSSAAPITKPKGSEPTKALLFTQSVGQYRLTSIAELVTIA